MTQLLRTCFLLGLCWTGAMAALWAQEIELPSLVAAKAKPAVGDDFKTPGFEVQGSVTWARSSSADSLLVQLARAAELSAAFKVPNYETKGEKVDLKEQFLGVFVVDLHKNSGGVSATSLEVSLAQADSGFSLKETFRLKKDKKAERLLLTWPGDAVREGDWTFKLKLLGKGTVLVSDISCFRLPIHPDAMVYAKPNGVDGPDRLESGALGFEAITIDRCAVLPVKMVREGSPADKAGLLAGDVLLSLNGEDLKESSCKAGFAWFDSGHEAQLGRAVEAAMTTSKPAVSFVVWRRGQVREIELKLAKRPALPQDFPFDQEVTPALYDDLLDFVRRTRKPEGYWQNGGNEWIQTCFAGLALLGRRDPQDAEAIREIAEWYMLKFPDAESFGNLGFWAASYSGIFMTEYLLATNDDRVRPFIARSLRWIEAGFHNSKWGTPCLGHGPSGLPYDQKALMAPASHVIVFEALANRAGFQSRIWETLLPYIVSAWSDPESKGGHGAMGYNASYRDQDEFWSRSGLFALAAYLRGEKKHMRETLVKAMVARHPYMRNSHAYGNPGDAWGLLALAAVDEKAFSEVMRSWRWSFGGAWEPGYGLRHSTAHMGSPYMGEEGLVNPAYAAVLAARNRGLFLLGAPEKDRGWLKLKDAASPESKLSIRFNSEGQVVIEAAIPGLPIHYSLDGRVPTEKSEYYEAPFELPAGGLVRAVEVDPKAGPLTVFSEQLGLPKLSWKILAADGAKTKSEAIERAKALIDGNARIPWQADQGEGSDKLPVSVTVDLGESQYLRGLRFPGDPWPRSVGVALGDDLSTLEKKVHRHEVDPKTAAISLESLSKGRYLRLMIEEMPEGKPLRIGEVELLWPEIALEEKDGVLRFSCSEPDLEIRVCGGDALPGPKSPLAKGRIRKKAGEALRARLFLKSGVAVGPVLVISE